MFGERQLLIDSTLYIGKIKWLHPVKSITIKQYHRVTIKD